MFCLPILLLMGIWVVSSLRLLWVQLLWTALHNFSLLGYSIDIYSNAISKKTTKLEKPEITKGVVFSQDRGELLGPASFWLSAASRDRTSCIPIPLMGGQEAYIRTGLRQPRVLHEQEYLPQPNAQWPSFKSTQNVWIYIYWAPTMCTLCVH